jgi:5-formyltetrahydrofolate cyclo-ligase
MQKQEARRHFEALRQAMDDSTWQQASEAIAQRFFDTFEVEHCRWIHCFLPILSRKEVNTWLIINRMSREYPQVNVLIPKVVPNTHDLESYRWTPTDRLEKNRWGIHEPNSQQNPLADQQCIDLVLIPLLAFDEQGYRVGYGKGFYDRFLARCRPSVVKVGVSLFEPLKIISDTDPHDLRMDYCIMPDKLYVF